MHINRVLIKAQESSPEVFKIGKTPELLWVLPPEPSPGHCPWTPKGPKMGPWTPPMMARALLQALDLGLSGSINFFDRNPF